MRQELAEGRRVVAETGDAVALAPYASRSPFETWILPRRHQSRFEDAPGGEVAAVARLLRDVLRRMDAALERPPYSFVIHSAPVSEQADFYHWHIEILPKVTRFGAFEWATGFHRNPTLAGDRGRRIEGCAARRERRSVAGYLLWPRVFSPAGRPPPLPGAKSVWYR